MWRMWVSRIGRAFAKRQQSTISIFNFYTFQFVCCIRWGDRDRISPNIVLLYYYFDCAERGAISHYDRKSSEMTSSHFGQRGQLQPSKPSSTHEWQHSGSIKDIKLNSVSPAAPQAFQVNSHTAEINYTIHWLQFWTGGDWTIHSTNATKDLSTVWNLPIV